jgi:hypothetical protein
MSLVEQFCDRAMMLTDGNIKLMGDPHAVGRAYLTENFATPPSDFAGGEPAAGEPARVRDAWIANGDGERVDAVGYGEAFSLCVELEALEHIKDPGIATWVTAEDGTRIFSFGARENGDRLGDLRPGERIEFAVQARNPLSAGRYHVGCSLVRGTAGLDILLYIERVVDIVSFGADVVGLVGIAHSGSVTRRDPSEI